MFGFVSRVKGLKERKLYPAGQRAAKGVIEMEMKLRNIRRYIMMIEGRNRNQKSLGDPLFSFSLLSSPGNKTPASP